MVFQLIFAILTKLLIIMLLVERQDFASWLKYRYNWNSLFPPLCTQKKLVEKMVNLKVDFMRFSMQFFSLPNNFMCHILRKKSSPSSPFIFWICMKNLKNHRRVSSKKPLLRLFQSHLMAFNEKKISISNSVCLLLLMEEIFRQDIICCVRTKNGQNISAHYLLHLLSDKILVFMFQIADTEKPL